jgi:hypothetical protein
MLKNATKTRNPFFTEYLLKFKKSLSERKETLYTPEAETAIHPPKAGLSRDKVFGIKVLFISELRFWATGHLHGFGGAHTN